MYNTAWHKAFTRSCEVSVYGRTWRKSSAVASS
jgi:hypothetical protein